MISIIGDVHGKKDRHLEIIAANEHTLQIGDLGFSYDYLKGVDSDRHKFFGGNHDNVDTMYDQPQCLGDFGAYELDNTPFFFIRGAFSVDWPARVNWEAGGGQKTWWEKEQLSLLEGNDCLEDYAKAKPDLVFSHSCPTEVSKLIGNPNTLAYFGFNPETFTTCTQELLQVLFDIHQPSMWVFGHFHKSWSHSLKGTDFICLDELETLKLG
jgi:hypothetical protein